MAKRILKSKGKTAQEAIDHGLRKIHLPRESVEVRLLREGRKILGLIPWDAIVYLIYDPLSTGVSLEEERNSSGEEAIEQVENLSADEESEAALELSVEELEEKIAEAEAITQDADEPEAPAETDSTGQEQPDTEPTDEEVVDASAEESDKEEVEAIEETDSTEQEQSPDEETATGTENDPEPPPAETGDKA
jgi:predicted RNA-binding protein Jag